MRSESLLERLTRLHPKLIDLSLDRIARLLAALDHPERILPPVVHVAGTNGKGSTIAFMKAVCEAAGLTVHVYTSPHLVRFHERIGIAGAPIGEEFLAEMLAECERANDGAPITFFEITTAAAFLAFSRVAADIALIETGLGGRFDATTVVPDPAICAITPVAMDHMHYLGDSLSEIAFEKAGILRPGGICVVAPQAPDAADTIARQAAAVGARLILNPDDWRVEDGVYADGDGHLALPKLGLEGPHQAINAGVAVAALRSLADRRIAPEAFARGLGRASWPGRLQHLTAGRLAAGLADGWQLWIDGGHNPAAAAALAAAIDLWPPAPLHLVLGMMGNRDPANFLAPLAGRFESVVCVPVPGEENSWDAGSLAEAVSGLAAADIADALGVIAAAADRPGRILVCGSLYLAGAALAANGDAA